MRIAVEPLRVAALVIVASLGAAAPGRAQLPAAPVSPAPVTAFDHFPGGQLQRQVQAPGVPGFAFATTQTLDTLDRPKDSTDPRLGVSRWAYSGRDQLTRVTDPRNLATQYTLNGLGDRTALASPDTGTATMTYDSAGNIKTRTDSRGVLATYTYDRLNRIYRIGYTEPGSTDTQIYGWNYDETGTNYSNGIGRLTSVGFPGGGIVFKYDPQGRIVTETLYVNATTGANSGQVVRALNYGYDAAGNLTSMLYPSGRQVLFTHAGGLLSAVGIAATAAATASPLMSQVQWEPFGPARSWLWHLSTGTQLHERVHDTSGRAVRYRLGDWIRDLEYDAADRITLYKHYAAANGSRTAAAIGLDQTFAYDELSRLTGAVAHGVAVGIAYDANGNRSAVTVNGSPRVYTTSPTSNRLVSLSVPPVTLDYDAAGNQKGLLGLANTWTYNRAGRLSSHFNGTRTTFYLVDAMGRRVRKHDSSGSASTIVFAYDPAGHLMGEYSANGTPLREYVWLGDTPVAMFTPGPAGPTGAPLVYLIHTDHLNTPRVVTDTAGRARWTWFADAFGTTPANTNPAGLGAFTFNLRFPGQYYDVESGLHYNAMRDYDAGVGRYVQSDPIGLAGGSNTYAYVGGDPVSLTDPTGELPSAIGGALTGAGIDITVQLLANGGKFRCIKWDVVAIAALAGAVNPFSGLTAATSALKAERQWARAEGLHQGSRAATRTAQRGDRHNRRAWREGASWAGVEGGAELVGNLIPDERHIRIGDQCECAR